MDSRNSRKAICSPAYALASAIHGQSDRLFEQADALVEAAGRADVLITRAMDDSGYVDAFYQIAEELGLGTALPYSPEHVFENEMLPRLRVMAEDAKRIADLERKLGYAQSAIRSIAEFEPSEKVDDPPHTQIAVYAKKTARTMLRTAALAQVEKGE